MLVFFAHLILVAGLLLVVAHLVRGIEIEGWGSAILGALVLGLVNAFVKPVMILLTLPITVLTLGLFLFVINASMLWLAAKLVPGIEIEGFGPALLGSLLLSLLGVALGLLLGPVAIAA
jgi:putative membrane protein